MSNVIPFPGRKAAPPPLSGTLWAAFEETALRHPGRRAIRDADGSLTFAQLHGVATQLAAVLAREAARDPTRPNIGMLGQNGAVHLATLLACARAGLAMVPINWRLAEEEWCWIADDARLACVVEGFGHRMPERFMQDRGIGTIGASTWRMLPREALPGGQDKGLPDTPVLICYTSGTTGRPKGAVLTQSAMLANARNAQSLFDIAAADRVLTVLPLFHVGGLNIQTLPALLAGAEITLHQKFEPEAFFDTLERDKPSLTLVVPAVMSALIRHPRWAAADLSCLRAAGAGSSDVPVELIEAFHAKGVPVQQVYGSTETAPIAIAQTRDQALAAPGSIGTAAPFGEAKLAETGEILVRGPHIMRGYWNNEAATLEAFTPDGWYRTGDMGRLDEQGRYWFTDRLKHIIISGGENISPAEIERVLREAPGVLECAVVGRPDPRWGEVPVAVVVPGPGFDAAETLRHFDGRLARFKHPRAVVTLNSLPRTALGKVNLPELKRVLAEG
jgi:fatty-acyl-CoA synthase